MDLNNILLLVLNFLGAILIIQWLYKTVKNFINTENKIRFFGWKNTKYTYNMLLIIGLPLFLFNKTNLLLGFKFNGISDIEKLLYSLALSPLVSLVWLRYILKLDIYHK